MDDPRRTGVEDDTDLDTQELGPRVRKAEADIDTLRATTSGLEREIALLRADLERLRLECEKAAGSKLP